MRTKEELEVIAEKAFRSMKKDLTPKELGYVLSCMVRDHALSLKEIEY